MCQVKVNVVTCEYIDLKIVPSPSLYMTNCSTAKLLLFFNNEVWRYEFTFQIYFNTLCPFIYTFPPKCQPSHILTVMTTNSKSLYVELFLYSSCQTRDGLLQFFKIIYILVSSVVSSLFFIYFLFMKDVQLRPFFYCWWFFH